MKTLKIATTAIGAGALINFSQVNNNTALAAGGMGGGGGILNHGGSLNLNFSQANHNISQGGGWRYRKW